MPRLLRPEPEVPGGSGPFRWCPSRPVPPVRWPLPVRRRSACVPFPGCSVYTSGSVTNGPPSSGQQVSTGSRSSRTSLRHDLRHRPAGRAASGRSAAPPPATSRAPQSLAGVGGSSVSASSTRRRISRPGRRPKASSARRAVPNRFVTSGSSEPSDAREEAAPGRPPRSRAGGSRRPRAGGRPRRPRRAARRRAGAGPGTRAGRGIRSRSRVGCSARDASTRSHEPDASGSSPRGTRSARRPARATSPPRASRARSSRGVPRRRPGRSAASRPPRCA